MSWQTVPLKRLARIRVSNVDKKSADDEMPVRLCNYTDVYYRDTIVPGQDFMAATASVEQVRAFRLAPGDVVITKDSETADDIGVPAYVAMGAPDLICGYHLAILRPSPSEADGRYLFWLMSSQAARNQLEVAATGVTRFGLRTDAIGDVRVGIPGIAEQRAIADFLDAETARIDALIAKKRQQRDLLGLRVSAFAEQQLLENATRELPLRRLLRVPPQYGAGESGDPDTGQVGWPRYIRITDLVSDGQLKPDGRMVLEPARARPYLLRPNDLLFARSGTVGKAFRYGSEMEVSAFAGYLIRLRMDNARVDPCLVEYWTRTSHYWDQIRESAVQATIENVSAERYKELRFPLPPRNTQTEIVRRLQALESGSRETITRLNRQIELLQEHRQALITAAVTGEFDVPGVAA